MKEQVAKKLFKKRPVGNVCQWFGTKWVGDGKDARLLICGRPAIGSGLFQSNIDDYDIYDLCERHAIRTGKKLW